MLKISACVIVKNETANILRWVDNMRQVADEIIVVDTGSTDNTVELAKAAGASVYHFPWINDFAAAKNFALDQATGNWVIFLDADEYFTAESLGNIRPLIEFIDPKLDIAGIICLLVNIDAEDNNRFSSSFYQLRIFRHTAKYRYEGKVHEKLSVPKHKKLELAQNVTIYHTGYSRSLVKEKMRRNLSIMDSRIQENGGVLTEHDERYYMDIWYGLDEREKSAAYARKIIARPDAHEDILGAAYETLLSIYVDGDYSETEVMAVIEEGKRAFPERSDFVLMQGLYIYRLHDYLRAEKLVREGLTLYQAGKDKLITADSVNLSADNAGRLLHIAEWCLGDIAEKKLRPQEALEHWGRGLKQFPYHSPMLRDFVRLLTAQNVPPVDIIQILNGIYDRNKDAVWLADTLSAGLKNRVWLYYAEHSGQNIEDIERYMAIGRCDAAAELIVRQTDRYARLGIWAERRGYQQTSGALNIGLSPKWQEVRRDVNASPEFCRMEKEIASLQ